MELPKVYDPKATENKWYSYWMQKGFFNSVPDEREPYTIVIPPPNVTGVLHMGHMLNNTIQDVLIRRARMQGKNACWVPGTDHASIATEAKVVAMLKDQGINKKDLTRDEFLKYAWDWKEKYGGIILEQLKKLGASCDWNRTRFTMEDDLSDAVIEVFIDLFRKGQIYRGTRMVNWDPAGLTAVSDEEVIHKEVDSTLYHVRYQVEGADEWITIATTRPETILGDTAVCVHPNDERYKHLHGKRIIVPIAKRSVPLITDEYVTMEFGTGALKVTPAHDINDYQLGLKHKLQTIDTLTPEGKLSEAAGFYVGEDRFVVRKKIVKDLDAAGHLVKSEPYKSNVGFSERTNAVIEPRISMQWFLKMDKISKPALENVMNDNIRLVPDKFKNTYRHWMENVHDWCISRQLWWGQRIPAWYDESGNCVVAKTESEARTLFAAEDASFNDQSKITQDEDVLDTWFSSWLWPISVFDGFKDPNNADIKYYYPTNDLVTAPEILFFWVARMIIAGYEYRGEKPFTNVYLTGIVRDKLGRKMSKSLGNSPDPLDLIEKYGADGVRTGMLFSSPAGNDLPFDEGLCEQGRNFANKIWNAFRLIHGWNHENESTADPRDHSASIKWFEAKLSAEIENINDLFSKYRISEALLAIYKLIWDDFCSWYLEIVKPPLGQSMKKETFEVSANYFEALMKVLHPFMPFITEEIWHSIRERSERDCMIVAQWPSAGDRWQVTGDSRQSAVDSQQSTAVRSDIIKNFEAVQALVTGIRNLRKSKNIPNREPLTVFASREGSLDRFHGVVEKLCNLNPIAVVSEKSSDLVPMLAGGHEYLIDIRGKVNQDEERKRIEEELNYTRGFLESVNKKLSNEKFMANAKPEIVASENKKKSDAESKIKMLEEQLAGM
jgi:valyl-tRNA synthetase